MKPIYFWLFLPLSMIHSLRAFTQVEMDRPLQMTGISNSDRQITGLGSPSSEDHAVNAGNIQQSAVSYAAATGSSNAFDIALTPAPSAYAPGLLVHFSANHTITGAATLNVNGLGAVSVKKYFNQDLESGDIQGGQAVTVIYDGTNFEMTSQLGNAPAAGGNLDFSLSVSPLNLNIAVGGNNVSTPVGLSLGHVSGNVAPVSINLSGLPSGVTATLTPAGGFPFFSSQLVLNVGMSVSGGTYPILITATGGGDTETETVELTVTGAYRVFVTSTTYNGNLGGLSGADSKCQARADAAGLGGTWKAWLSSSSSSAASRLTQSSFEYQRLDGMMIASNWTDLTDGSDLSFPISVDEFGNNAGNMGLWTSTTNSGGYTGPSCNDWTSSSSGVQGRGGHTDTESSVHWTNSTVGYPRNCNEAVRLYCFEQ